MMTPINKAAELDDSWRENTLCSEFVAVGGDPDLWFRPEDTYESKEATSLCWECPVRKQCLEWAAKTKQRNGVWGGQPSSVRLRKGEHPHDYESLSELPNPYETDNHRSVFFDAKLHVYQEGEDDE